MKLYEKKFPIYENCMISIFGQPGSVINYFRKNACLIKTNSMKCNEFSIFYSFCVRPLENIFFVEKLSFSQKLL